MKKHERSYQKENPMIFPGNLLLNLVCRVANLFGLDFDFCGEYTIDSLDEEEISEQLQYGRD